MASFEVELWLKPDGNTQASGFTFIFTLPLVSLGAVINYLKLKSYSLNFTEIEILSLWGIFYREKVEVQKKDIKKNKRI